MAFMPSEKAVSSANEVYDTTFKTAPPLVEEFETRYDAWKKTWPAGTDKLSSSASSHAQGVKFDSLTSLGPKIIPLVVHKLTTGSDFFAVLLNNAIERDPWYIVDPKNTLNDKQQQEQDENKGEKDDERKDDEQAQLEAAASIILEKNLERNEYVDDHLKLWSEHMEANIFGSHSSTYLEGEGYWGLIELGPGIVTRMMLEYYKDQSGWWHELLHELVHGATSNSPVFVKAKLFEEWSTWFESGEWKDVPKGMGEEGEKLYRAIHGTDP